MVKTTLPSAALKGQYNNNSHLMDHLMVLEDGPIKAFGTAVDLLQSENQFSKAYQHLVPLN
ncbi:hypothetical protein [Mongoliitalea lutea]|uniref:Uncharacterized protein n=1 Tax=Mongoliitalea lutea TaxID=849756 RepID=A0A8J3CY53_9BACT|nr:hypothetical protein [Mongoliitalea lutea]GHB37417.1 hypothetical protein GCM10008106_18290 [Mongoliitalea lutea]